MSILEEFYYGNVSPGERYYEENSESGVFAKKACDLEERLSLHLSKADRALLQQLISAQGDLLSSECKYCFIDGWRLGVQFMLDTFKPALDAYGK